jgi:hypothetical protein
MDLSAAMPQVMWTGTVNSGQPAIAENVPPTDFVWIVLGIDVYAGVQPNNGDFSLTATGSGPGGGSYTIYQIQQSQNFPGPFAWRGIHPIFPGWANLTASSSVEFAFVVWGLVTPNYTLDFGTIP